MGMTNRYDLMKGLPPVSTAIRSHVETFGGEALEADPPALEAFDLLYAI